jgi:hypothetical protein
MHANVGDSIIVDRNTLGTPPRRGTILDVRQSGGREYYQVQWEDGHVSTFFPSSTARVLTTASAKR